MVWDHRVALSFDETEAFLEWLGEPTPGSGYKRATEREEYERRRNEAEIWPCINVEPPLRECPFKNTYANEHRKHYTMLEILAESEEKTIHLYCRGRRNCEYCGLLKHLSDRSDQWWNHWVA